METARRTTTRAAQAALVASLVLLGLSAGPAAGHGGEPELRVDPATSEPGGSITITLVRLAPGTDVEVRLAGPADGAAIVLGSGTVPVGGDLTVSAAVPPEAVPGTYVVEAHTEANVLTADLTIVAAGSDAEFEPGGRDEEDPLLVPLPSGWSRGISGAGPASRPDPSPAPAEAAPLGAPPWVAWAPAALVAALSLGVAAALAIRRRTR